MTDRRRAERPTREIKLAATLQGPHIVPALAVLPSCRERPRWPTVIGEYRAAKDEIRERHGGWTELAVDVEQPA